MKYPGPTESLIEKERGARVREALDTLPPNWKAGMILRHYKELSYAEIAQILGVTPKAVESHQPRRRLPSSPPASFQEKMKKVDF